MELIKRDADILTGQKDLEELYTFRHLPINFGVTLQPIEKDLYADAHWMISQTSGMIQLGELIPDYILYEESHHAGNALIWQQHYECFAEFLHSNMQGDSIVEIGGGNGNLYYKYHQKFNDVNQWCIVEPSNIQPIEGVYADYERVFYNSSFTLPGKYQGCKNIVHSHLMEHILDLDEFMETNRRILPSGGVMIFSIPNLKEEIRRKYSNALMFEHTYYLSEEYVDVLLKKYGFSIKQKEYYRSDHSIFIAARRGEECIEYDTKAFEGMYSANKKLFMEYVSYYKDIIKKFNEQLKQVDGKVYLFGAHVFSQFLIANGLDTSRIECVLDNDKLKQNKRLYGTGFMVRSPKILQKVSKPNVILKCGAYDDEIADDILKNINSETSFLR